MKVRLGASVLKAPKHFRIGEKDLPLFDGLPKVRKPLWGQIGAHLLNTLKSGDI